MFRILEQKVDDLHVDGMTTAPGLKDFILSKKRTAQFYGNIDDSSDLVSNFIAKSIEQDTIDELEDRYQISLWKFLYAERRFFTHMHKRRYTSHNFTYEELIRIGGWMLLYFEKALENIDCVVMQNPASSWAMAASIVAEHKGIPVRAIRSLAHPNDRAIWGDGAYEKWENVNALFEVYSNNKDVPNDVLELSKKFIIDFRSNTSQPPWIEQKDTQGSLSRVINAGKIKKLLRRIVKNKSLKSNSVAVSPTTFFKQLVLFKFYKKYTWLRAKSLFQSPKKGERYAFFALHLEPEAALSVNGQHCLNQLALIEKIARQLPAGCRLYIKEHPTMVGWRSHNFYRSINKIPNVRNIDPRYTSIKLVEDAHCILTVNGTVGWEATLRQKPVVTFGYSFYNELPGVQNCADLENIGNVVSMSVRRISTDEELAQFLSALFVCSFDLSYEYHWMVNDDKYERIYDMSEETQKVADALLKSFEDMQPIKVAGA